MGFGPKKLSRIFKLHTPKSVPSSLCLVIYSNVHTFLTILHCHYKFISCSTISNCIVHNQINRLLKKEIEGKSKRALRKDIFKSNRNFELGQVAHWITSEQLENVIFTELCLIAAMWVIFSCHELVDHLYLDTIQDFFLRAGHDTTYASRQLETIIFSIHHVIGTATKIIKHADKNLAHF